jgi:hypothetical protein
MRPEFLHLETLSVDRLGKEGLKLAAAYNTEDRAACHEKS